MALLQKKRKKPATQKHLTNSPAREEKGACTMKTIKTINELRFVQNQMQQLQKISRQLHTLAENACNYGLSKRQETRQDNLMKQAEERAQLLGLHAYHQGDPRGCCLYLVEDNQGADTQYTDGIAVC
jgi:predicted phage-related endonuclease